MNALELHIRSRRPMKAPTGNKSAGLSARSCGTSQVHEAILWTIFLPQQGIVSMFFSGVGRQPISASPVLFLANEVWVMWLQCCRLCKHECSQAYEHQDASPLQKPYLARSNKDSIVFRLGLTYMYLSLVGGSHRSS